MTTFIPNWNTCKLTTLATKSCISITMVVMPITNLPLGTGALPTVLKLKEMKGADGLNIVQKIAAHDYSTFGMHLLNDGNGEAVDLIEKDNISKGAEGVTQAILKKWLTSDAPTRTYQHLIECLRQSQLGALAKLIETQGMLPTYMYIVMSIVCQTATFFKFLLFEHDMHSTCNEIHKHVMIFTTNFVPSTVLRQQLFSIFPLSNSL